MSSKPVNSRRFLATIRARLTLWWTTITLGTCALICTLLYIGLSYSLSREVDGFLEGEMQEFTTIVEEEQHLGFDEIEGGIRRELGSRLRKDLTFRLLDASGKLVVTSDTHDAFHPADDAVTLPKSSSGVVFNTLQPAGAPWPYRICSQWVTLADKNRYQTQAVYRLDHFASSLAGFRQLCFAAMAVAAGLSVVCGLVLAGRSLQPVRRMTDTARRIGAENLTARLAHSGTGDELDALAGVLNDMLARLERQFGEIQRFTADAAHELRTPIAALRGNMEIALNQQADVEELRLVIEESIDQFDKLSRIADDLLLLARADAGRSFLQTGPVNLTETARDMVDLYGAIANERDIELSLADGKPVEMFGDDTRIRQLLSNLLDNALRYTPNGGRVMVSVAPADENVELRVSDNGPGIAPEHIARIFDRFYRADAARTSATGGSGLGLAICRSIAQAHNGTIGIASQVGAGTEFVVSLPFRMETSPDSTAH
ncbi:MAG: heavy metal sensor histidine kinase [Phycisphaerales bacterium]|nr:heavy metal sensor histidine kinase [Phycisphaerales bacterium]